jgi:hypothetical protein
LWFAPPKYVPVQQRAGVFLWLDVSTKLSIVDIAMMMILLATVLLLVGGSASDDDDSNSKMSDDLYALSLVIVPPSTFLFHPDGATTEPRQLPAVARIPKAMEQASRHQEVF